MYLILSFELFCKLYYSSSRRDRERRTCATVLDRVCASLCVRILLLTAANVGSDSRSIPFGPEKKEGQIVDDCYLFVTL